jgi:DNA-binding transcriptional regulator GbsR (MarR family)
MIEYLLPLKGIEFSIKELTEEVGVSRPSVTKAIKKFVEWGLVNERNEKYITYYSINYESPIVKNILQLNNLLIERMIGDEALYEIHDYLESKKPLVKQNAVTNYFEIESEVQNWTNISQSVFEKSNLWQEKGNVKFHHFNYNTEEKPISKSFKPVVVT